MNECEASILDQINSPEDLKHLPEEKLGEVAEAIRNEILSCIAERGGHLASSLGVVELTIALHYVFNTPDDRLVWDVGHQTYPHKLLTGRRESFRHVRQYGGPSGFPKRSESPFDSFGAGHASTSISAAVGMAEAAILSGSKRRVVAIIGDGGLTGGMAFEALNQTPSSLDNLIVVLNDNEMSIAPSVGQLSSFLSKTATGKTAGMMVKLFRRMIGPLPDGLRDELEWMAKRSRQSFLGFWTPGILIEALGYHYIGPVNGHNIDKLLSALEHAKTVEEPTLVHIITSKGKGYTPAEEHPITFHGIGPFDLTNGKAIKKKTSVPSYTRVFADTMIKLFKQHPEMIGITAAMPQGTGLDLVQNEFPDRVFDLGITEPHSTTFAAGMACEGYRPVVAIYSTFLQRAYDQIVHDVCLQKLPVIFCLDRAGIVGEDGPTHHGMFDIAYLRNIPEITLMAPADENEMQHMLRTAIEINGPCAIRYPRGRAEGVEMDSELKALPVGKAQVVKKGSTLYLLALGNCVHPALAAAQLLDKIGIDAGVVNMRFIKPIDSQLIIELASADLPLITIEEHALMGGFGSAVMECIEQAGLHTTLLGRVGIPDKYVEQGTPAELRKIYGLDAQGIADTTEAFLRDHEILPPRAANKR